MKICLFLHAHQPPTQFPEIVEKVSRDSYRKIFSILEQNPQAKITLNVTASLVLQLPSDVLDSIRRLVDLGQIELTGTGAYHPILPFLPEDEIERQILLNKQILNKYFGAVGPARSTIDNPQWTIDEEKIVDELNGQRSKVKGQMFLKGFFPPEMAVDEKVLAVIKKTGSDWVIVEESAVDDLDLSHSIFNHKSGLKIVRRNRSLSLAVAFSQIRHIADLLLKVKGQRSNVVILAMDAETFGHHRPEQLELLEELFKMSNVKCQMLNVSELIYQIQSIGPVEVKPSTWADSFNRWQNPQNPVHVLQWQLTNLAINSIGNSHQQISKNKWFDLAHHPEPVEGQISNHKSFGDWDLPARQPLALQTPAGGEFGISDPSEVEKLDLSSEQKGWLKARSILDKALHSDQYWWSAHNPCWHYEMVKKGARLLLDSIEALPEPEAGSRKREAKSLYEQLLATAAKLYGTGVIAC